MNRLKLILLVAAATLFSTMGAYAQEPLEHSDSQDVETTAIDTVELYRNAPILEDTTPKRYRISKVNIHGVKSINPTILRSSIGLQEGDSIYLPSSFISTAIQNLWNQRLYADVEVGAVIDGEDVEIDIMLSERPRVFNWRFEGVNASREKDLTETLKLRRNTELSDYVIDKNTKLIKEYLGEKGFRNAEVDIRIDNDTIRKSMVNVTFVIDQKERVRVEQINFIGNTAFEDKRLRRAFKKTHQRSINIFNNTKLKEEEYELDKEYLIDFYNSKGYRNATIVTDSIYDINEKRIGMDITVSEGNKYYIRNISWVGNSVYPTEQLESMLGLVEGQTYDKKAIDKRLGIGSEANPDDMSISSLYQNEGYLMSMIEPAETIIGADSIDIQFKVFEGKPFTISNVIISGNTTVDDESIRRELYTRPGELYNRALLMQTMQVLSSMGHFNPEAIMPDIRPVSNSEVNIGFPLEEQSSNQVNLSGGWGSGTFIGSASVTLNNISINDFFKKGAWQPYPMGKNQSISVAAQTNGTYYKAFSASFTDPWLGGKKPNSFSVSAHYSDQNDAYYTWQTPSCYFRTTGIAAGLGKRLTWPDPYFQLYSELSYDQYNLKDWGTSFLMSNGTANQIALRFILSRNSVDQQIYPRRGSNFTASVQVTPPYSLWDGIDYGSEDITDQDRYRWIEYHRWTFNSQWYQSLSPNGNLVLMLRADMGYLGNYDSNKISPFERFEVGGDGMSNYSMYGVDIIGLRGYEDGALDPSSSYSLGYNKYTIELRYPVILKPASQIYVLGFAEGGSGFDSWSNFSPFKIKRSAGFGVRLNLQVVGMLGVDWGYGFDPAVGETEKSGSQFHFVLGQQF